MSSDFARTIKGIASNEVLIPIMHAALYDPEFEGFSVPVTGWQKDKRHYDGWFHPSYHSTWTVRQLYIYLTAYHLLEEERMPLTGVLAVTAGKFWHMFIQRILLDNGILVKDEVPIRHEETNRLGHADGYLSTGEALEIKTINGFQVDKIISEAVLREKKPQYWAQTQDYLDCLGLSSMRYLMINPDYPFRMSEFVVMSNRPYQVQRRAEYKQAIELAQRFPDATYLGDPQSTVPTCCAPRSKEARGCPTKHACPIGRLSA